MKLYSSSGQNTGSQALGPAASLTGNWLQGALATQAYNAASQDYSNYMGRYGNYGGQSGGGTNLPGLIGGGVGATAAIATGNPQLAPTGFSLGYGLGSQFNR